LKARQLSVSLGRWRNGGGHFLDNTVRGISEFQP
jgi:hypothetical protein